jgi:hypothetical protein
MASVRTIDVNRQKDLPWRKIFHLCVKGITDRLLRSVLTLAVIVLAVAFFMFLLSENMFIGSVADGVEKEIVKQRLASRLLAHWFNPPSSALLSMRLSAARQDPPELGEYAAVTGWDIRRVERLADACGREQAYLAFFDRIPVGKRLILIQKHNGRDIFRFLADPEEQAALAEKIKPMLDLNLPGGTTGLMTFVTEFPAYEKELSLFTETWRDALDRLSKAVGELTGGKPLEHWLSRANSAELKAWEQLVQTGRFQVAPGQVALLQEQLRNADLRQEITKKLNTAEKQAQWRKTFQERRRLSLDEKLLRVNDPRVVAILDNEYSLDQLARIAKMEAHEKRLTGLEQTLVGRIQRQDGGKRSLSARQGFLLFISFVVCMVGISNAMLMSITERFREIATMKCLGATDRYILIQFVLEAGLQGIAGGILGMGFGAVIAMLKTGGSFGSYLFTYWPGQGLLLSGVVSLGAGVLLAVVASIYPAWVASRMAPMEAMRIE